MYQKLNQTIVFLCFLSTIFIVSCTKHDVPRDEVDKLSNQVIIDWNLVAFQAEGGATYQHPLISSRVNAMVHIAMHDAINAIAPMYESYVYNAQGKVLASPVAAAANAAHTVLFAHFPERKTMLDSALSATLAEVTDGMLKEKGLAIGEEAGNAILDLRSGDSAFLNPIISMEASTVPGVYNVVPPFNFLFAPHWKTMQLFSLERHDQFRSLPHPLLTSNQYTKDFNEVKTIGALNSSTRTPYQSATAKYWYEFSEITWNRVARLKSAEEKPGLFTTARLFALLNMALADSYTSGWNSKFYYNFWRPYTAIRAAHSDGNEKTIADPKWEPAEPTPAVQDYPSTHSVLGNAGATVLSQFFGNHSPFTMTTTTALPGEFRSYKSFKEGANENADSRVLAGIHFRFSCNAGQKMGDEVAKWTVKNYLKPLH